MIALALGDVAAAVGGRLDAGADPGTTITSVTTDSRAVGPGALFVAIAGEHVDGHDFAAGALGAGASAVLAERPVGVGAVVAPAGALRALADLAREVLARRRALGTPFEVLALTGSSGKTSTKDLLAAVLASAEGGPDAVVAPPGSFNNELGVPLTALRVDEGTRALVVEMGARSAGHIAALCEIVAPGVGAVLNVGSAHLGVFGGVEEVARAKGELVEALPPAAAGGVAVLSADDQRVAAMAARTRAAVVTTGLAAGADVRALDVTLDAMGRASFTLVADLPAGLGPSGSAPVSLRLHGEHHVANALAAAAMALVAGARTGTGSGLDVGAVAAALSGAGAASRWRMEVTTRADGVVVVNDAYNANPESVRAALRTLVQMRPAPVPGSPAPGSPAPVSPALAAPARPRTWAVLGEMLELGDAARVEHDAVGRYAVRLDVSHLVVVGEGARAIHTGAVMEGSWGSESVWVPDADAAHDLLAAELAPGDVVLVKSSHGAGLRWLGERLARDETRDETGDETRDETGALA